MVTQPGKMEAGETIVFSPSEFIFPLSRVLTFSTTESLHILSQADQILIDGTFRTTPALWKQVTNSYNWNGDDNYNI